MAAGSHNFKVEQGADFNNTITYEDASGNKINISEQQFTQLKFVIGAYRSKITGATS